MFSGTRLYGHPYITENFVCLDKKIKSASLRKLCDKNKRWLSVHGYFTGHLFISLLKVMIYQNFALYTSRFFLNFSYFACRFLRRNTLPNQECPDDSFLRTARNSFKLLVVSL